MHKPVFTKVLQLGIVVKDLDASVKNYADKYGIGPWAFYDSNEVVTDVKINGKDGRFSTRMASAFLGDVELELIEPLDETSIFAQFLKEHGEGIQHIAFDIDDYQKTLSFFKDQNIEPVFSGKFGEDEGFVYMDTQNDLALMAEFYDRVPNAVYPAPKRFYPMGK